MSDISPLFAAADGVSDIGERCLYFIGRDNIGVILCQNTAFAVACPARQNAAPVRYFPRDLILALRTYHAVNFFGRKFSLFKFF